MRIERYELTNFGSHRHTTYEPGDAGLCIIQGANGLGKSTLVSEALGAALYGDFRGSIGGVVRIGQTDASAVVEVTLGGVRYRAIWRRTTKGAGKTSADLQVQGAGGAWSPLASGAKEVPAEVASLLHMDANTFRTSVSLAQSDLRRFVDATAAGRKEVLASIVVDPRFAPAAAIAARRARDLEATSSADQAARARLADAIAELKDAGDIRDRALIEATRLETVLDERSSARKAAEAVLEALTTREAAAAAQAADLDRHEAEITALGRRYHAVVARKEASTAAIARAEAMLVDADIVEQAGKRLPAIRTKVEQLTAGEAEDRKLAGEMVAAQRELDAVDRPHAEALTTWRTRREAVLARIAALEGRKAQICEACGQPIDEEAALEQLRRIRAERDALGEEPKAPLAIARASAALSRLETRRRELAWDPASLIDLRTQLTALERTAARGEAIAGARETLEREQAAVAAADDELEEISVAGKAARARLEELNAAAAELAGLNDQVAEARDELARIVASWEGAQAERRDLDRRIASLEANVERLGQLQDEHAGVTARLAAADVTIGRLRHLALRFGLKGIPARVIEGVLPELTRYANDALGALFGLQLDIRATRSSADGKTSIEALDLVVCKEGTGEVELARASGGQGTAIALAMALGLARLNARRAGTAIKTWIVDEPEGLDVVRLKALGGYLRDLVHRGELERVFVITHTTELAEFGDRVDEVTEGPDGVELQQVA